ncbi:MAG: hypothetical protein N2248_01115 [candidate division WOR-3 bacterium]|nr:hypothetical protein [candidate division WOR-3 bacterium]
MNTHRWVQAVNRHGGFGKWAFTVCRLPVRLAEKLKSAVSNR